MVKSIRLSENKGQIVYITSYLCQKKSSKKLVKIGLIYTEIIWLYRNTGTAKNLQKTSAEHTRITHLAGRSSELNKT